jgi:hypothetical protein
VGETPNLAARLQGIAEPNGVVIAKSTRKLVGNLFELEDLGAQDLKGISGPVRAWAALRPSSVERRFEAMHASSLTELVGREEELELLLRRWSKAKGGEGQVVLLSGEAGIGKSRLTAALLERLATEPHTRLRYFCSPQHTDSALYPIINQMERAAGFTHEDNAQRKLNKLDALLAKSLTPPRDAALLADMLSLPNDGRYPTLELEPQQRRQKTLEALTAQLEALVQSKPVLMIFEDVHWIDATTLEAVGRTVDRLRTLDVLLIVTYRPEFEPPWIGRPYVTALTLNRFGEREIAAMIDRVTGNKALSESIRQDIIERTDGVPLFVEEMTKAVPEAESESEVQRTTAPVAAIADTNFALNFAREIGLAVSLMFALYVTSETHVMSGNYEAAKARDDELLVLAEDKGAPIWKALGMMNQGALFAMIGKASDAVRAITLGISTYRSTGSTLYMPWYSSILARAYAELGQVDDAWRCVAEAMTAVETTKERWCEAEIHRMAGETALKSAEPDVAKAQVYFERALTVARQQHAKSWELRAAMSLARLWRSQGKVR